MTSAAPTTARRTKVFLACSGLGHVARGFETFTQECFDALRRESCLDVYLFKGAGPAGPNEYVARSLLRDSKFAKWIERRLWSVVYDGYYFEQTTFALSLIPHIIKQRPDVVYLSDGVVGNILWRWKQLTRSRFKLLLCNGGQLGPHDFPRYDHVHHGLAVGLEQSSRAGRSMETQTLIPQGFQIDRNFSRPTADEKKGLRERLGLPANRPVILSIGVVNSSIKRMDVLIRAVAQLPEPRPVLVVLGQRDAETPSILQLASEQLSPDGFICRTVPANSIEQYVDAADVFALASPKEGFGRVLVEALARGLCCVVPDRPYAHEILHDFGCYFDIHSPTDLPRILADAVSRGLDDTSARARHAAAYERFSWDRLAPKYVEMIERCAAGTSEGRALSAG
ncbi:MAG: glycosyl transferase [Pirellula sp.]|nr:glycosyl transferase [Pirellula sp.]